MREQTRTRPIFLSIFLCLLALVMAACGGPTPSPQNNASAAPPDKQVLRYPIGAPDFSALDPAVSDASTDYTAVSLIFPGLVRLASDNSVVLDLASGYQMSQDGMSYTFTLHPNLTFSDGTPLTATDVAYSINRTLTPATASPTASFLSAIKDFLPMLTGKIPTLIGDSLIVNNQESITIVLSAPAPYFLQELAGLNTHVVNKALIAKYGKSWTEHLPESAGAGVFKVASYSHSQGMVLVPNPDYYGAKARLQKLEFLPSSDPATVYKEYLASQLDYAQIPLADLAGAKSRKDYHHAAVLNIDFLAFNFLAKPFDNVHIRQAFALAIDKDVLARNVLHGAYTPTNHLLPQGMPGYNHNLTGPAGVSSTAGDKTKAQQLLQQGLQEAGYSSVSALPAISFTFPNLGQDFQNVATAIVQQWQTVLGVTAQLKVEDVPTFVSRDLPATSGHAGPLQVWFLGYTYLADPFFWLNTFFGKGGSLNDGNYGQASAQQAVQQELATAATNTNPQQRTQQYNDAEQKIVDDVGWIPLFQAGLDVLLNPKVQNLAANGLPTKTWSDVYISV
ncbi:MAG: peptide ABC transporter substrate-binding protein [Chloroflexota bacterium]|nr:peptide ABC transporter substrate-binding protein [Chloroflexota bacterium]